MQDPVDQLQTCNDKYSMGTFAHCLAKISGVPARCVDSMWDRLDPVTQAGTDHLSLGLLEKIDILAGKTYLSIDGSECTIPAVISEEIAALLRGFSLAHNRCFMEPLFMYNLLDAASPLIINIGNHTSFFISVPDVRGKGTFSSDIIAQQITCNTGNAKSIYWTERAYVPADMVECSETDAVVRLELRTRADFNRQQRFQGCSGDEFSSPPWGFLILFIGKHACYYPVNHNLYNQMNRELFSNRGKVGRFFDMKIESIIAIISTRN